MWSAPNYLGRMFNLASILEVDENLNKYFNLFEDSERQVSNLELKNKFLEMLNNEYDRYFQ